VRWNTSSSHWPWPARFSSSRGAHGGALPDAARDAAGIVRSVRAEIRLAALAIREFIQA